MELGDVRDLSRDINGSFDAALTSPPYLNAIDYLRGHRLSLIWFGYPLDELQRIRGRSIGSERSLVAEPVDIAPFIKESGGVLLAERYRGWVRRYAAELRSAQAYITCDVESFAGRILAPTLVLHGTDDREVYFRWSEAMAQAIPRATFRRFEGGHHSLLYYNDEAREQALTFLGAH